MSELAIESSAMGTCVPREADRTSTPGLQGMAEGWSAEMKEVRLKYMGLEEAL